ncbi:MAG: hypothetical protein ACYCX3_08665 [Thermoleophilia bacterium]
MKRSLVILLTVAVVFAASGAVAYAVAKIYEKQPYVERVNPGVVDDPGAFLAEKAVPVGSGPLEVPVYREDVLLNDNEGCFSFARDSGVRKGFSFRPDTFEALQIVFPSAAIRWGADGASVYVIYDTDASGSLYVFFSEKSNYFVEDGFPILMKKKLAYEDFAGIEVGDGIAEVEGVDPVAALYRGVFDTYNDVYIENTTSHGWPPTSVHLLTDGILKIEYRRDKALGYAITNIAYSADFVLDGLDGKTSYKIDEADYVK